MAEDETAFSMEYLPGQYDQRCRFCYAVYQIISGDDKAVVASAKTYVLKGKYLQKMLKN